MAGRSFDVARRRMRNQRLAGAPLNTPTEVVRWFGAIQAQEFADAKWAIALRTRGATEHDVERAYRDGAILRTHILRPTWHFVLPGDLRWMLALTAPRIKRAMAYHDRRLGLDERTVGRSNDAIAQALSGGKQLTRRELAQVLARLKIETAGQRLGHLMLRAELDAVICSGARRGKQFTYALLDERCPPTQPISRDEALGKLASRYFASHGPALLPDFAWWSGLSLSDARRGIALAQPKLSFRTYDHQTYWFADPATAPRVRQPLLHLLPYFDEYLVAYRHRDLVVDAAVVKRVGTRVNLLAPVVVRDGKVIGSWRRKQDGTPAVTTTLVAKLTPSERRALDAAIERFDRFLTDPPAT